jgi:hypothetical protein
MNMKEQHLITDSEASTATPATGDSKKATNPPGVLNRQKLRIEKTYEITALIVFIMLVGVAIYKIIH